MARQQRQHYADSFANQGDFNEQLYLALRQAPWWMISIAIHLMLFFILNLIDTTPPVKAPPPMVEAALPDNEDIEEEVEETPEDTEEVQEKEVVTEEPVIKDEEIDDHVETDNDLPDQESFGETEGMSDAPFEGPSNNGTIGLGGGAGGAFKGRGGSADKTPGGGGKKRNDAVMDALKWLKAHQSPGGQWEGDGFQKWCDFKAAPAGKQPDGVGKEGMYDPGITGLALCAFLGAGYTNRGKHPFKNTVSKGLRYLKNVQDPEGCFGARASPNFIYNHATASLAMVEAYGMTESTIFKTSAQRCLEFIAISRNPYFAWRYGVKPGDNDSSVTGWMMMAIKSAKLINADAKKRGKSPPLVVDEDAFDGVKAWIDKMTDPDYGRVGYITRGSGPARPKALVDRFPSEKSESMTAVGVLAKIFMGIDPKKDEIMRKGAELCYKLPPVWNESDGSIDMYYWYYGALAMHQMGGKYWKAWKEGLEKAVIETQRKDTDYCMYKGSWNPVGPWGEDGGRVYSTAILALCLEVWYRYDRVFGASK
jgi:hypothetical protein